jgi:hypothetical protein
MLHTRMKGLQNIKEIERKQMEAEEKQKQAHRDLRCFESISRRSTRLIAYFVGICYDLENVRFVGSAGFFSADERATGECLALGWPQVTHLRKQPNRAI